MITNTTVQEEELFATFTALLADKMGLFYPRNRWKDLEKKLYPLMVSLGFSDSTECIRMLTELLKQDESISDLAYHLTIGETYFFRDSRAYTLLEQNILPAIIQHRAKERKLRIWSAGCCTGEEPYSIAMLLHRMLPDIEKWDIHLVGSDINNEFLRKARQGHYGKWSLRSTPADFRDNYFVPTTNGYQVAPEIMKMVRFMHANLVNEGHIDNNNTFDQMDLVLCNNVLIYFSREQVDKTIRRLTKAIVPQGWLEVSAIEAPFVNHPDLSARNFEGAVFFKKDFKHIAEATMPLPAVIAEHVQPKDDSHILLSVVLPEFLNATEPEIKFSFPAPTPIETIPAPAAVACQEPSHDRFANLCRNKQYDTANTELQAHLEPLKGNPSALNAHRSDVILLIRTLANQGHLAQALEWCDVAIGADKLDPIKHYLKAEVLQAIGDAKGAAKSLKNSIFLDPDFATAHYMLGLLEHGEAAQRQFKITLQLLDSYQPDDILPGTEELTAERAKDHLLILSRRK
ncbi:MAG: CheR family methyltransferase [Chlamydiales bacterium]|nr:CheR family methyltransferase [Chlamydiales bacterium]